MSRLAKRPIEIPKAAEVTVASGLVRVKGPKGTLERQGSRLVNIAVTPEGVQVSTKSDSIEARAALGTYASHVRNMFEGVTKGFSKKLLIEGVGYKWDVQGKTLNLALGFSHPVKVAIPEGLVVKADKGMLMIDGFDKEAVGQFAANIRALKKPEPYKGKGIRYDGEVIRRKQGKKLHNFDTDMKTNIQRRHARIRAKVKGTGERPRLAVYKSNRYMEAQLIDDTKGRTLVAGKMDDAVKLGETIAKSAKAAGISAVVFDRGGFRYAGRVAALAEAARKGGLNF